MLRDCLKALIENKALVDFKPKVKSLYDSFDNNNLEYVLGRGVTIDQSSVIFLNFNKNIGFRCTNVNQNNVGKLPICNQIEKILNEKYVELINQNKK